MKALIVGYQNEKKLRRTAQKACEASEFWRERFKEAKVKPECMKIEDLVNHLDTIKITPKDLYDPRVKNLVEGGISVVSTSGTTGRPKEVYVSEDDFKRFARQGKWFEIIKDGDRILFLVPPLPSLSGITVYRTYLHYSRDKKTLCYHIPPNLIAQPDILVSRVDFINPTIIVAFPTVTYLLSNILPEKIREKVKFLIMGGEELPINLSRKILKRFPNAKIIDIYGTTEDGLTGFRKVTKKYSSHFEFPESLIILAKEDEFYRIYITKILEEKEESGLYLFNYDIGDYAEVKDGRVYRIFRGDDMISLAGAKLFLSQIAEIIHRYPNLVDYVVIYYPLDTAEKPKAILRIGYTGGKPSLEEEIRNEIYKVNNPVRYEVEETKRADLEIEEVEVENLRKGLPIKPGKPRRLYVKGKHF